MNHEHTAAGGIDDTVGELIDRCHRAAVDAATRAPDVAAANALVQARLELAAESAELERLRRRPEVKLGQLVRGIWHRRPGRVERGPVPADDAHIDRSNTVAESTAPSSAPPGTNRAAPSGVIVVRNRRAALVELLALLAESGVDRIDIVDNASSDPATLELLAGLGRPVRRFESPIGADEAWASGLMAQHLVDGPTLLIGGDTVPADGCPADVIERMSAELGRRPDAEAVSLPAQGIAPGGRRPRFELVRAGAERRPRVVATLSAPYGCRIAPADADDPAERFASHHDDDRLELSSPPTEV